jgi:hypothetical protein
MQHSAKRRSRGYGQFFGHRSSDSPTGCGFFQPNFGEFRFPMVSALIFGEFAGKSQVQDTSGLRVREIDTATVIASGHSPWPSTQPKNLQPAQSPRSRVSITVRIRTVPCWLRDACSHQERFSQEQEWGTSKHKATFFAAFRGGRTIWIADAHRDDGKRFVVHADEVLTAFLELESQIAVKRWPSRKRRVSRP